MSAKPSYDAREVGVRNPPTVNSTTWAHPTSAKRSCYVLSNSTSRDFGLLDNLGWPLASVFHKLGEPHHAGSEFAASTGRHSMANCGLRSGSSRHGHRGRFSEIGFAFWTSLSSGNPDLGRAFCDRHGIFNDPAPTGTFGTVCTKKATRLPDYEQSKQCELERRPLVVHARASGIAFA